MSHRRQYPPKLRPIVVTRHGDLPFTAEAVSLDVLLGLPWRLARPSLRRRRRKGVESARHQRVAKKAARRKAAS